MVFDSENHKWSKLQIYSSPVQKAKSFHKQAPEPRFYHTMNVFYNFLVIFGGGGDYIRRLKARESFNDIWFFDTVGCTWTNPDHSFNISNEFVPKARMYHASSIINNGKFSKIKACS